jgi:predicted dehydrogenase
MPPVRIGVIGCGSVMNGSYMPLAERLRWRGLCEVVMACDTSKERLQAASDKYNIPKRTTDYRDVINADEVDLVLVLTSMPHHGSIAGAALEAGKHVLVEKPMAVTLPEAADLVAMAKTSRGYLLPAPHVILSDTYQTMWRRIHRGDIGKVLLARARYGWAGPDWGRWFYEPGGGSMFDLGVYNVVSLTGWLGPAKRVTGMVGVAVPERMVEGQPMQVQADDNAHILIDFGDSVFAVVTTGFTMQRYRSPAIELYGTQGTLQMMGDDWAPDGYELWQNDVGAWQIFGEQNKAWPWTDGLRHMVECIRDGQRPMVTPEQHYHALEIMIKAQAAGRDGQARDIESTFTPQRFDEGEAAEAAHRVHAPKRS